MKRALVALALAAAPSLAHAGWGFSYAQGPEFSTRGYYVSPMALPTFDIHLEGAAIQINALDLVSGLTREEVILGGNVYVQALKKKVTEDVAGVVDAGGSLDLVTNFDFDPLYVALLGQMRLGAQAQKGVGAGLYVIPGLGVAMAAGELELAVGGQLQFSVWVN